MTAAASAAAEQDLGGIMAIVSDQFEGPGRTTKRDIKRTLFAQMHRGQWRRAFVVSIDVALAQDAERADVVTYAVLAEGEDVESWQDVLPSSASTDRFDLAFEREGGDWRVVKARYQPADLGSLPGRPADE